LAWLDPNHKIASLYQMQWDPWIITAWGQDVFWGAGNVMTQIGAQRSTSRLAQLLSLAQSDRSHNTYRRHWPTTPDHRRIQNREERRGNRGDHLSPPTHAEILPSSDLYRSCSHYRSRW
jgi:hypothetical protein